MFLAFEPPTCHPHTVLERDKIGLISTEARDSLTFCAAISACDRGQQWVRAVELFARVAREGVEEAEGSGVVHIEGGEGGPNQ